MENFTYHIPTKIYFGDNEEDKIGLILNEFKIKKILLHYGQSSIKKNGLYDKIVSKLKDEKIEYLELGGVTPNPKLSLVLEGVKICKENDIELVLAVGGGSVIDSAKAIAQGALVDHSPWEFSIKNKVSQKALPVGVILTLAAAGSEMSSSCVITNDETLEKRGFNSDFNRPLFSILNPKLTYSVNKYQTACGIVDIMMHTLERYFSPVEYDVPLTDNISLGLLKAVIDCGRIAFNNPNDYNARANLMWASSLSHNDLTALGKSTIMSVHQMEHELSGMFDSVAHGAGLAVLWPYWALEAYHTQIDRFYRLATEVLNVDKNIEKDKAARLGILKLQEYYKEIGMPITLHELGIYENSFEELARNYTFKGTRILKDIITVDYEMCLKILYKAK